MRRAEASLLAAIKQAWDTTDALATRVPGGLWLDRVEASAASPYGLLTIEAQDPEFNSSPDYLQSFRVGVTVWSSAGPVDAAGIQAAVGDALDPPAGSAYPDWMVIPQGQVIRFRPLAAPFVHDDRRKDATDVMAAQAAWEMTLQLRM